MIDFILPEIGEGIETVSVSEIFIKENDVVKKDDSILLVETDKASMEIPIDIDGKVINILINKGDLISAGQKILITGSSGSGKTTLMNIISGIIQPDNGKYILDSAEMNSRFKILNLGYVTQKSFFMPDTILNNICFGLLPQIQEKDKVIFNIK